MRKILYTLFLVLIFSIFIILQGWAKAENHISQSLDPLSSSPLQSTVLRTPLSFEANQGQTDSQVQFLSRGKGYTLFLTSGEAVLALHKTHSKQTRNGDDFHGATPGTTAVVRMRLIGGNPMPSMTGEKALPGKAHYFIGNDPTKWRSNVPTYAQARYSNVYPGIDLVYYGNQQQLEYDFVVAPGKDPSVITMNFQGADAIELEPTGDLLLHTSGGTIRQQKPIIYQEVDGKRQAVQGGYLLTHPHHIGFQVRAYDSTRPLIIDPVLVYSTYLGGGNRDVVHDMAIDTQRNVYLMGLTLSTDFPVMNPIQPSNVVGNTADFFVTKFSPDGATLVYATYLGGTDRETGRHLPSGFNATFGLKYEGGGLALDELGQAYLTGTTASSDFPLMNALQPTKAGAFDAFVTKLSADGSSLIYSTYLGGKAYLELGPDFPQPATNRGNEIAIDEAGNAYITGLTNASDFPTKNAFQPLYAGGLLSPSVEGDAFVSKISSDGSSLVYSTYLGGAKSIPNGDVGYDEGIAIAVDRMGSAYVTGFTFATDFPTLNAFKEILDGSDIFLTKFTPDGKSLVFSTFLGGSGNFDLAEYFTEQATGLAVDESGHAYLTGWTFSKDFPVKNAFQSVRDFGGEGRLCFITKFTSDGSDLEYSTMLSGTKSSDTFFFPLDHCKGIAIDAAGNAYVTGETYAEDFPTTTDAFQRSNSGGSDAFITKLTPNGSTLAYSTYLGGIQNDGGIRIAVDPSGIIYVSGYTASTDFPTMIPYQSSNEGDADGFLVKIEPDKIISMVEAGPNLVITLPNTAALHGTVMDDGFGIIMTIWSQVSGPGVVTFADEKAIDTTATFSLPGIYVLRLTANAGNTIVSDDVTITVNPAPIQNQAPSVNAGTDQTITLLFGAVLNGRVTDDGLPNPPGTVTTVWIKASGPGEVSFGDPNAVDTTATFSRMGTFVLRLTASDGALASHSDLIITVTNQDVRRQGSDLDGDGKADIVWRNTSSSVVAVWLMNGTTIGSAGFLGGVPTQWKIGGVGDVNGDGKADVIWQHSSGVVAVWLMDGFSISSVGFPGRVSSEWQLEGVGDANGDSKADVVWRNSRGVVAVWLMNGGTIASAGFFGGVSAHWQIEGVGDVNGDGKADVVWRNTSGGVALWLLNGLRVTSVEFPGSAPHTWAINKVGDVDGDGKADIVWRNTSSNIIAVWLMNGKTIAASGFSGSMPMEWQITQAGDVNGDSKADVIWRNNLTGEVKVWIMNGWTITIIGSPGTTSTDWEIQ